MSPEGASVACCQSRLVNLQLDSMLMGALHRMLVICDVDPEFDTSDSLALWNLSQNLNGLPCFALPCNRYHSIEARSPRRCPAIIAWLQLLNYLLAFCVVLTRIAKCITYASCDADADTAA